MEPVIKHSALNTFVTVAETGNIVEAAERLGRTPSAISMALKQLEECIGGTLFEGDRKSKMTALGRHVFDTARSELLCFDRAVGSMRAFARNRIGRIDIASVPSIAHHYLPDAIKTFSADRPEVELELRDADTVTIVALVEGGQVDFGIGGRPQAASQLDFEVLIVDRFIAVCPIDSPWGRDGLPVEIDSLVGLPVIANGASDRIWDLARQVQPGAMRLKVWNVTSLISLVRGGLGLTILPELSVPTSDTTIRRVPLRLKGQPIVREVGLITRRRSSMTPAAAALCDHLKAMVQAAPGPGDR